MWKIIVDAVPQMVAAGIKYTIPIAIVSFAIGLIIALITALTRISARKGVLISIAKGVASFYVWLFRSTPLLVQLFIVFFGLPSLVIPGIFPHGIKLDPVVAGIITFSLNTGAYCAETIRASGKRHTLWGCRTAWFCGKSSSLRRCEPRSRRCQIVSSVSSRTLLWRHRSPLLKCFRSASKLRPRTISHC